MDTETTPPIGPEQGPVPLAHVIDLVLARLRQVETTTSGATSSSVEVEKIQAP